MMSRTLQLIPNNKRNRSNNSKKLTKTQIMSKSDDESRNILVDDKEGVYGIGGTGSLSGLTESVLSNTMIDDDLKEYLLYSNYAINHISDMTSEVVSDVVDDIDTTLVKNDSDTALDGAGSLLSGDVAGETVDESLKGMSWDPRLVRIDGFNGGNAIVPFASHTASSAFYDHLFVIERGVIDLTKGIEYSDNVSSESLNDTYEDKTGEGSYKIAPNAEQVGLLKQDADMYGTQSLMNPYCVTRLVGGLSFQGSAKDSSALDVAKMKTHMYDIRDRKRFYDNISDFTANGAGGAAGLVDVADDFSSIGNPTTDNIIKWSNADKWGRTPYSFQDFVFCKYWNVIPNNRLITFRKYAVPTYDNLNFPNMLKADGTEDSYKVAPIATVVAYFGGDSPNKLNDFMKFTTGTKWKNIEAEIHKVQGNEGSNPRALVDSMFENNSGFGGQTSGSSIVNKFLGWAGGVTSDYLSFGKMVGLLDPDGYNGHSQKAWDKLSQAQMDPREQIYVNRIVGPVNRISSVQARDAGIEFSQTFSLTCEYIARPIGGINTKAAMLDILSNCMEIASVDAVWWGGGFHYMVKPSMYPFKRDGNTNTIMEDLYAGRIFGKNGAIAHGLEGILKFGQTDKNGNSTGSFDWSNVTSKLGDVLSQTVGAIGNMLESVSSALFGESSSLTQFIGKVTDSVSTESQQASGKEKLNNLFGNINKMWKDRVIQESVMPNVSGLKTILTGEPTGNWHLTLGNPLNPILVCGNLICKKMDVNFGDELGPDDFPLELSVTYTIEHSLARDKGGIQSMFNRGAGKIYKLPDYIRAASDYESTVDKYTGENNPNQKTNKDLNGNGSWTTPHMMSAGSIMASGGVGGWGTFKIDSGKMMSNWGNAGTTQITCFKPVDRESSYRTVGDYGSVVDNTNTAPRSAFFGNLHTRKYNNG